MLFVIPFFATMVPSEPPNSHNPANTLPYEVIFREIITIFVINNAGHISNETLEQLNEYVIPFHNGESYNEKHVAYLLQLMSDWNIQLVCNFNSNVFYSRIGSLYHLNDTIIDEIYYVLNFLDCNLHYDNAPEKYQTDKAEINVLLNILNLYRKGILYRILEREIIISLLDKNISDGTMIEIDSEYDCFLYYKRNGVMRKTIITRSFINTKYKNGAIPFYESAESNEKLIKNKCNAQPTTSMNPNEHKTSGKDVYVDFNYNKQELKRLHLLFFLKVKVSIIKKGTPLAKKNKNICFFKAIGKFKKRIKKNIFSIYA